MTRLGRFREQLAACKGITSLELHARLHRLAMERHAAINLLSEHKARDAERYRMEKAWRGIGLDLSPADRRQKLTEAVCAEFRTPVEANDEEAQDVVIASALVVLDEIHVELLTQKRGEFVQVDDDRGTWLLGPESTVLRDLSSPNRRLPRERRDFNATELAVPCKCRLIHMEARSSQTLDHAMLNEGVDAELWRRLEEKSALHVGLCSPFGDCHFRIYMSGATNAHGHQLYYFQSLEADCEEMALADLRQLLQAAFERKLDILCFPELTVDSGMLAELKQQLRMKRGHRPALVVAGSFHQPRDGSIVNRCILLDGRGRTIGSQNKIGAYSVTAEGMRKMPPALLKMFGGATGGVCEDIGVATKHTLNLLESTIGRLATPICRDFFDRSLGALFDDSGTNLFLVPSMTPSLGEFKRVAKQMGDARRACVLLANSLWLLKMMEVDEAKWDQLLGMVYLPRRGGAVAEKVAEGLRVIDICKALASAG